MLNPVQPPAKRAADLSASIEVNDYAGGYTSPDQNSESTRISNLKYHSKAVKQGVTTRDSIASTSLSKISKVQPSTMSPAGHMN